MPKSVCASPSCWHIYILINFLLAFKIVDPAYVEFSPDVMDQKESLKRIMEQKSNISAREEDVEAIVCGTFSSKFPEVSVCILLSV